MNRPRRFTPPPPDDAEVVTGHGIVFTAADDYAPGALWYDFRWSVPAEVRERHGQIRTLALEKPACQAHGAAILDLWSGRDWQSADDFVAAIAAATGLDHTGAAREARRVLREYFLLCDDLLP
jgi:hypothetical protein